MDRRHVQIVERVRDEPGIRIEELAQEFEVSTRTMRTYVRSINEDLGDAAQIVAQRGKGYRLEVQDAPALAQLLRGSLVIGGGSIPNTPEERVVYLVNDLVARTDWVTLDELASIIYISPRTLSDDLKQVEEVLTRYGLALERRPRYGLRVTGSELNRRLCMASLATQELTAEDDLASSSEDTDTIVKRISICVDDVTQEEHFSINSLSYQNLIVHIAVAITRIRENCYVPMEAGQLERIRATREYEVAGKIARRITKEFELELPEEEVAYIAIHLSGKRSLQPFEGEDQGLVISDEVWAVVDEMVELVWDSFHFDFRSDLELKMNLARHIVPLATRLQYHMNLENPLLSDIKTRFPLAYSMAVDASTVLTRTYGSIPSEDEVGYLALAFALALERQKGETPKKNILVVCASGAGSAKLLEYRYRQEFGAYVDQIITSDVTHIDQVDFTHIDYVFTTVPIHRALPVPVREVGFFLDAPEIAGIKTVLTARTGELSEYESYFSPELFFPHVGCASKEEVIALLCDAAHRVEHVSETFDALIWEREELAQTAFGNFVAMPHPMQTVSESTFVAVCLLDAPVMWSGREVRAIFMVSIAHEREHDLNEFYDCLAQMLLSSDAIRHILREQTFEVLLEEFRRFEEGEPSDDSV